MLVSSSKLIFNLLHQEMKSSQKLSVARLLVVGLFSKGRRNAFISGTGRTTRRYGREGLGTR